MNDNEITRMVVIWDDGRHAIIAGSPMRPAEASIDLVVADLAGLAGGGGWLCIMAGLYFIDGPIELRMQRQVAPTAIAFAEAERGFHALRAGARWLRQDIAPEQALAELRALHGKMRALLGPDLDKPPFCESAVYCRDVPGWSYCSATDQVTAAPSWRGPKWVKP